MEKFIVIISVTLIPFTSGWIMVYLISYLVQMDQLPSSYVGSLFHEDTKRPVFEPVGSVMQLSVA